MTESGKSTDVRPVLLLSFQFQGQNSLSITLFTVYRCRRHVNCITTSRISLRRVQFVAFLLSEAWSVHHCPSRFFVAVPATESILTLYYFIYRHQVQATCNLQRQFKNECSNGSVAFLLLFVALQATGSILTFYYFIYSQQVQATCNLQSQFKNECSNGVVGGEQKREGQTGFSKSDGVSSVPPFRAPIFRLCFIIQSRT